MKRIGSENKKNIYMAKSEIELLHENIDYSVVDSVKKYDKGTLVKLR